MQKLDECQYNIIDEDNYNIFLNTCQPLRHYPIDTSVRYNKTPHFCGVCLSRTDR